MAVIRVLAVELAAETAAFHARMSAAGAALDRIGGSGGSAHKGVALLRGGLERLALEATGLQGPLGQITRGMLTLGGGGGVALVAAAAIGTVGVAVRAITGPTDAATKSLQAFTKGLLSTKDAGEELRTLLQDLGSAQARTLGLTSGIQGGLPGGVGAGLGAVFGVFGDRSFDAGTRAAQDAIEAIGIARHRTASQAITDLELQTAALSQTAEQIARVRAAQEQWNATDTEAFVASVRKHEAAIVRHRDLEIERELLEELALIQKAINLGQIGLATAGIPLPTIDTRPFKRTSFDTAIAKQAVQDQLDLAKAMELSSKAAQEAARAHQLAAAQIITAVSSLIAGLASGFSFGGLLQSAGGFLGLIKGVNPIIGAFVSGVGAIVSAFDSNEERRHGELIRTLEPVGEVLFLLVNSNDPDSIDSFVRRAEQATGRRVTVRFGGR